MLSVRIKSITLNRENEDRVLLEDINFDLTENKISVILGKNGTGKSTLIKSFTRLLDKRFYSVSGNISLDKEDLLLLKQQELLKIRKTKISYVFQDAINSFDPLKRLGYYFREYIGIKKLALLLNDFLLPEMKTLFRLYPYELSGGMAQRLMLVLALLRDPEILILDEPTSGIDSPISNLILLKLKDFVKSGNNSVLLVTQELQFAKSAGDKISFLSDGTLSEFFNTDEFFELQNNHVAGSFLSSHNELI